MTLTPMPLDVAVKACFPHGGVTKSTLLAEIRRGRLGFEKIGRTYFVTEADIQQWRKSCRATKSLQGSICAQDQVASRSGLSSMTEEKSALAAAQMMIAALKKGLGNTSRPRTTQTPGNVIRLKSRSRTFSHST